MKNSKNVINFLFIGDATVGRTSLIEVYCGANFNEVTLSTIGIDSKLTKIKVKNGEEILVKLWDSAGQARFRSLVLNHVKKSNGVIITFSLDNKPTFYNVENLLGDIKEISDCPVALVGCKSDLMREKEIAIEAKAFAEKNKISYFETSSRSKANVKESIEMFTNEVYDFLLKKNLKKEEDRKMKNNKKEKKLNKENFAKNDNISIKENNKDILKITKLNKFISY